MAAILSSHQDLASLIMRATNPLNDDDDPNLVQSVCQEVGNDLGKIQTAVRMIVHKMQSPHEREALQALLVLQACINNCGPNFHSEIGKFRFLNEMIKLVSPKYFGNQTPESVKKRVVELLYTWTIDLKSEAKIYEAYDMLKKQGVVKEDPNYLGVSPAQPVSKSHSPASFEDEKKSRLLQRLLQSKRPEDISKANALIKHMVKEDERRMERSSRRIFEVETALNNVKVLDEMLTQYRESNSAKQADLELMEELFSSCQNLRSNIFRIVSEMEDKEDGMGDLLKASDELSRVMGRYKLETEGKVESAKSNSESKPLPKKDEDSLLDLSPDAPYCTSNNYSLGGLGIDNISVSTSPSTVTVTSSSSSSTNSAPSSNNNSSDKKESILDELEDVFSPPKGSNDADHRAHSPTKQELTDSNLLSYDIMHIPLSPMAPNQPLKDSAAEITFKDKESLKPMNDLDLLGSSLLRESLPNNIHPIGFQFKGQEKVSMNELKSKSKLIGGEGCGTNRTTSTPSSSSTNLNESPLVSLSPTPPPLQAAPDSVKSDQSSEASPQSLDLSSLSLSSTKSESVPNNESLRPKSCPNVQLCEVKPLSNIHVQLEDIKPGKQSSVSLMEGNGVSVVLHFTENKPREDVSIIVVSVTSKNPRPISNYVLQAVGPKGCKVRLQPPSGTSLAEYSPFLPPPAITQIMLIANPNQLNVSLKMMLSYTVDDDPVTDMGEIDSLPL